MRDEDLLLSPKHMRKHVPSCGHAAHAATADSKTSSHTQSLTALRTSKKHSVSQAARAYLAGTGSER